LSDLTDPEAVRKAAARFDELGRSEFLSQHGFGSAYRYYLRLDGKRYDAKAIIGAAWGFQFPERGSLRSPDFASSEPAVKGTLERLGFEVLDTRVVAPSLNDSGDKTPLHLIVKWNPKHATETIAKHQEVANIHKAVWWGVFSSGDNQRVGVDTLAQLQQQLDSDVATYAWLMGPAGLPVWRTSLLEISDSRPQEEKLVPSYYPPEMAHKVWLKLRDFQQLDRDWLLRNLEQDARPGKILSLGNQTNPLKVRQRTKPRVWWVNQGSSWNRAREGGYIWAPLKNKQGRELPHWNAMKYLRIGDVILHYANTRIRAVGRVLGETTESPRPDQKADQAWGDAGRRTEILYRDIDPLVALTDIPQEWRLKEKEPFTTDAGVQQGYLYSVSDDFASKLNSQFQQLHLEVELKLDTPQTTVNALTIDALREAAVDRGLMHEDGTYAALLAALESGKHVILTGPPGTAKTTLAEVVANLAKDSGRCAGYLLTTATADWTTYETIGGLKPDPDQGLTFAPGHFLEAIESNQWLIIDELNRSNFDRAFGQLFTVLSGQAVELPYARTKGAGRILLWPVGAQTPAPDADVLKIPTEWRVIATMNVFDKSLLFEMSFALMRRFAFVEVPSPPEAVFHTLIDREAEPDDEAATLTKRFLALRRFKDLGPAVFMDLARFLRVRRELIESAESEIAFEGFYAYLLPQFEGIEPVIGEELYRLTRKIVGSSNADRLRNTLNSVLGLQLDAPQARSDDPDASEMGDASGESEEPE
jgi:MoxR-like ATPase